MKSPSLRSLAVLGLVSGFLALYACAPRSLDKDSDPFVRSTASNVAWVTGPLSIAYLAADDGLDPRTNLQRQITWLPYNNPAYRLELTFGYNPGDPSDTFDPTQEAFWPFVEPREVSGFNRIVVEAPWSRTFTVDENFQSRCRGGVERCIQYEATLVHIDSGAETIVRGSVIDDQIQDRPRIIISQ